MMVMKVLASTQQNQGFEDNMQSNLTTELAATAAASPNQQSSSAAAKKKRSLPGNPDPDDEVVALSPKSLMATNRFVCEVCHKGFRREQNLQLHRRGHNLPWKLSKQRPASESRKKVYVCPEASCVHHHPSRALGDLTGIKKHFSRKHGEKKYKCHKCDKKYAVHSDWKAHSKTCGTKEYKCDCGTIFSRRDSFITHRAFCDALAEENAKAIPQAQTNPYPLLLPNNCTPSSFDQQHFSSITPEMNIPSPWLPTSASSIDHTTTTTTTTTTTEQIMYSHKIENPSPLPLQLARYQASASPHLSATALLQKAARMGATMSRPADQNGQIMPAAHSTSNSIGFSHGSTTTTTHHNTLQEVVMMMMAPLSYDERECGLGLAGSTSKRDQDFVTTTSASVVNAVRRKDQEGGADGLTRDFLGPRAFSHKDILSMASSAGLPNCMTNTTTTSSSFQQCQQNNSKPWHDLRSYHHEKYDVSSEFHTKHS